MYIERLYIKYKFFAKRVGEPKVLQGGQIDNKKFVTNNLYIQQLKNKMTEPLERLRWEHYIAIGLLLKNNGSVDESEAKKFDPKIKSALTDLHDNNIVYWGEHLCLNKDDTIGYNRPGYSLTDEGREYLKELSKQGVELFPFLVADEWEYPDLYDVGDLEKEVIS